MIYTVNKLSYAAEMERVATDSDRRRSREWAGGQTAGAWGGSRSGGSAAGWGAEEDWKSERRTSYTHIYICYIIAEVESGPRPVGTRTFYYFIVPVLYIIFCTFYFYFTATTTTTTTVCAARLRVVFGRRDCRVPTYNHIIISRIYIGI